jgi:hypothetical protein
VFETEKRQAILLKQLQATYGGSLKMMVVQMPAVDDILRTPGAWYARTIHQDWGLPPIRGPPSFALYKFDNGKIILEDVAAGGPSKNIGVIPTVRDNNAYWIGPVLFGMLTDDGKKYLYKNQSNLVETK